MNKPPLVCPSAPSVAGVGHKGKPAAFYLRKREDGMTETELCGNCGHGWQIHRDGSAGCAFYLTEGKYCPCTQFTPAAPKGWAEIMPIPDGKEFEESARLINAELASLRSRLSAAEATNAKLRAENTKALDGILSMLISKIELQEKLAQSEAALSAAHSAASAEGIRAGVAEKERDNAKKISYFAFVAGAKWWLHKSTGFTAFPAERDEMEAEAAERYPYAPHPLLVELERERDEARAELGRVRDALITIRDNCDVGREGNKVIVAALQANGETEGE